MEVKKAIVRLKTVIKNIIAMIKILMHFDKKYIILLFLNGILLSVIPFISIIISQQMLNSIQKNEPISNIILFLVLYSIAKLVYLVLNCINSYLLTEYNDYLYYHLNVLFLKKCSKLNYQDFEDHKVYDALQRAEQQIGVRPISLVKNILSLCSGLSSLIISIIILSSWHLWSLIGFIVLPFAAYKYFVEINKKEYEMLYKRAEKERKGWYLTHLLTKDYFVKEIKMFDLSTFIITKFDKIKTEIFFENRGLNKRKTIFSFLYKFLNYVFTLVIIVYALLETILGKLLFGNFMTYISTTGKVEAAINVVSNSCFSIYTDSIYMEYILSFFRLVDENEKNIKSHKIIIDYIDNIEFKKVSYKYKNSNKYSLNNVSLLLRSGEIHAIVGENGSGKSTLIKILSGFYLDYEGEVLVNGIELKKIDIKDYQKKLSTVFQDYNNYEFNVRDNIGIGDVQEIGNLQKIIRASKLAEADKIIDNLPMKYNQQLGNWFSGGVQLSGGQWQKIAIARSLIKDGQMYILDEPTAALDPSAELSFFKKFKKQILDKIGIFVTHRFSNVKIADKIFVLKDGELIESGTHNYLMKLNKEYAKLYNIQIGE